MRWKRTSDPRQQNPKPNWRNKGRTRTRRERSWTRTNMQTRNLKLLCFEKVGNLPTVGGSETREGVGGHHSEEYCWQLGVQVFYQFLLKSHCLVQE